MAAYYNENDPFAAQWLRNLISKNFIAPGDVDERSILDVAPDDLRSYRRCHFFAGIGGWDYALQLAAFPSDREVWTGSCPCQPFSAAGQARKFADERHLWPYWHHLIAQRQPATVFGEQVASKAGLEWFDLVWSDLEAAGYAVGVSDLGAASVGAPHIRQRLWFVANAAGERQRANGLRRDSREGQFVAGSRPRSDGSDDGATRELADANGWDASAKGLQRGGEQRQQQKDGRSMQLADAVSAGRPEGWTIAGSGSVASSGGNGELGDAAGEGFQKWPGREIRGRSSCGESERSSDAGELGNAASDQRRQSRIAEAGNGRQSETGRSSPWRDLQWLPCTDGKARPVESGTFPLAHGIPGRVGRLRAYGNAIVPHVAAAFVEVAMRYAP